MKVGSKTEEMLEYPKQTHWRIQNFFFLNQIDFQLGFSVLDKQKTQTNSTQNYNENLPKYVVFPSLSNFIWRNGEKKNHRTTIKQEINF